MPALHQVLETVSMSVWQASWQAACLAVLVWATLCGLGQRLAPRWRFAMWSVVFIRLALPALPSSPVSVFALWATYSGWEKDEPITKPSERQELSEGKDVIVHPQQSKLPRVVPEARPVPHEMIAEATFPTRETTTVPELPATAAVSRAFENRKLAISPALSATTVGIKAPATAKAANWRWQSGIVGLWLSGVMVLLMQRGWQQWRLARKLRSWQPIEDARIASLLSDCCRRAKIGRRVTILATDDGTGPAMAGIVRPRLLISPAMLHDFPAGQLEMIFLHELAHVRRHDSFIQELLRVLCVLHWFNPVVWWTLHRMELEREMACDEFVLTALGSESRQAYGRTLLEVLERGFGRSLIPGLLGTLDRLQHRIATIRDFRLRSRAATWLAIGLFLFVGVIGLTNPTVPLAAEDATSKENQTAPAASAAPGTAARTFSIHGKCVDEKGQPISDAKLVLLLLEEHSTQPPKKWEQKSGLTGEYQFEKLPVLIESASRQKSYFLAVSKPNWTTSYRTIDLHEQTPQVNFEFTLSTKVGVLSGRVLDEHGQPLAGASVYAACDTDSLPGFRQSTTDAQGRYTIGGLNLWKEGSAHYDPVTGQGGVCTGMPVRIKHPNYPITMGIFSGIPQTVDVQLTPGIHVEGRVVDTLTGRPAAGILVHVEGMKHEAGYEALTDAQGKYQLLMFDDQYKIVARAPDRVAVPVGPISKSQGKATRSPDLLLVAGAQVKGRLLDKHTGKPHVRVGKAEPAHVLCYGSVRTASGSADQYATVADDGTFQFRAAPGLNRLDVSIPFDLTDRKSSHERLAPPKLAEISLSEGETVSIDLVVTPNGIVAATRSDAKPSLGTTKKSELVLAAAPRYRKIQTTSGPQLVERANTPVGKLINRLEYIQVPSQGGDAWGEIVRSLIELGPLAVPELIVELDAAENSSLISTLAFVLRGIGDRRAIPALIRALPRTCLAEWGDGSYEVSDLKLAAFLRKYDVDDQDLGKPTEFHLSLPMHEVGIALSKLSGTTHGENDLVGVRLDGNARQQQLQRSLFQRCAERWAGWWQQNWKKLGVDEKYAEVHLPVSIAATVPHDRFPHGPAVEHGPQHCNEILPSVRDPKAEFVFYDFDTGRHGKLPEHLKTAAADPGRLDDLLAWAAREGYDIMGAEYTLPGEKKPHYVLRALGLTAWEIDAKRWRNLSTEVTSEKPLDMGTRTNGLLAHYDVARGQYVPEQTAAFLFMTRDGSCGAMFVGVEVHDDNWKPVPDDKHEEEELNPTGYTKGRRFTHYLINEAEPKGPQRAGPHR